MVINHSTAQHATRHLHHQMVHGLSDDSCVLQYRVCIERVVLLYFVQPSSQATLIRGNPNFGLSQAYNRVKSSQMKFWGFNSGLQKRSEKMSMHRGTSTSELLLMSGDLPSLQVHYSKASGFIQTILMQDVSGTHKEQPPNGLVRPRETFEWYRTIKVTTQGMHFHFFNKIVPECPK